MKFIRAALYTFLAALFIVSIFILLNSPRKTSDSHILQVSEQETFSILVHPEKYLYYDIQKEHNLKLHAASIFFNNSPTWTEFLPGLYIHSAFANERTNNSSETLIHIIAVGSKRHFYKNKIECIFQDNKTEWANSLTNYNIIRHKSFRYFMFTCISKNDRTAQKICLENKNSSKRSELLDIYYPDYKYTPQHEVTICVLPRFNYTDDLQLLMEFLGYYDTVGVSSFIFYDNMANETNFLTMVSQSHINLTIIPWVLPNSTGLSMQRILEIASVQHCIFKNRGKTKFVLPVHIDEFLVPRQHFSLVELMNELSTISKQRVGSYIFRKSHFCSKDDITPRKDNGNLVSSQNIFREEKIWPAKQRSRFMARPETVIEGGVHYIRKHKGGWKSANVPWQLALIHQYKSCFKKKNVTKLIEDRTAESFKYEILMSKPMSAFREFKHKLIKM